MQQKLRKWKIHTTSSSYNFGLMPETVVIGNFKLKTWPKESRKVLNLSRFVNEAVCAYHGLYF